MKHFDDTESLITLRDWLRFAVSRFNEAKLFFGHGSDNAFDEAAYLILHTLHLPLDRLEPFLDASLTHGESEEVQAVIERRVKERLPAAYLTHEAWLGEHRFYVDERVIVPRSFIAELLNEQLAPWVEEADAVTRALDLCTGSAASPSWRRWPSRMPRSMRWICRPMRWKSPRRTSPITASRIAWN
jgi:ribosomal protein L3 glutamine methyltransferase